jgi:hypothetical protein
VEYLAVLSESATLFLNIACLFFHENKNWTFGDSHCPVVGGKGGGGGRGEK